MATKKGTRRGPKVGSKGPGFELKDQDGDAVSLEGLRGRRVLLSFHPAAFTGVCTQQMKDLEANMDRFAEAGVVPLGISVDNVPSKRAWAKEIGLERLRILADFHQKGAVARGYDLYLADKGVDSRANVLLDEDGKVVWAKEYDIPQLPDIEEVFAAIGAKRRRRGAV